MFLFIEPCGDEGQHYCYHGGRCCIVTLLGKKMCFCPDEYTGERCEKAAINPHN